MRWVRIGRLEKLHRPCQDARIPGR